MQMVVIGPLFGSSSVPLKLLGTTRLRFFQTASYHGSLDTVMEPALQGAQRYWRGKMRSIADRRQLHKLLSAVCDLVYPLAPQIRNALVKRQNLSTVAVVAVKKVVQGLLTGHGEAGLVFVI